jgi:hypothetical protein
MSDTCEKDRMQHIIDLQKNELTQMHCKMEELQKLQNKTARKYGAVLVAFTLLYPPLPSSPI